MSPTEVKKTASPVVWFPLLPLCCLEKKERNEPNFSLLLAPESEDVEP